MNISNPLIENPQFLHNYHETLTKKTTHVLLRSGVPEGMKNWWCYYSPAFDLEEIGGAIKGTSILSW